MRPAAYNDKIHRAVRRRSVHERCRHRVLILLATAISIVAWPGWALAADAAQPTAFTRAVMPHEDVAQVQTKPIDREAVRAEDERRDREGLPYRFAIRRPVQITPETHGTWEVIDDDTLLWRLRVTAPSAQSLNLGFTRYLMANGGRLFVYATDQSHVIGPYTDRDNEQHGQLWTPVVLSDEIVVELTLPAEALAQLDLELTAINHGYRAFGAVGQDKSGACNIDVVCPEGDDWRDQIRSVGWTTLGGTDLCSGALVNNTRQDCTPYFLTADHCGIDAGNAATLVVYWNYETTTCGGPRDGSLADNQTGSYFRASYSASDFTLVELDDDPDPSFNVYFAGWTRSSAAPSAAVLIHHPSGDEKSINFENDPTSITSWGGSLSPGDGTHIRIADWDAGAAEPGSSGAPLFNSDKRIVGQHHGGGSECDNDLADWSGRLSTSWTGGGTSATRLSDWLDPTGTAPLTLDGRDSNCYIQTHKLTADDAAQGDRFARSVAISGNIAIVGAHLDDDGGDQSGSAYVFAKPASLTLQIRNPMWGDVEIEPNDPNWPPFVYPAGTEVTLTAVPVGGRGFRHWQIYDPIYPGDASHAVTDANNPITIVMYTDREVEARFECGSGMGPMLPMMLAIGLLWLSRALGRQKRS